MTGQRGLADDRVPRSRRPPVLRRHLLPARRPSGHAGLRAGDGRGRARRGGSGATTCSRRRSSCARRSRAAPRWASGCTSAIPADLDAGAVASLREQFDPRFGGFGRAPKFPQAMTLAFLLDAMAAGDDDGAAPSALTMATASLDAMAAGGIYDQVGGGFHRYSVDAHWLVPHFEKMLYDQALLVRAYVQGWLVTGEDALPPRRGGDRRLRARATCAIPPAASSPPRTPTPKASRASSTSGRYEELEALCGDDLAEVVRAFGVTDPRQLRGSAHRLPGQHPPRRRPHRRPCPTPMHARPPRGCFAARDAAGPARPRRQGAARLERAVPALARRGRRRVRPRRLDGRRARERTLPARRAAPPRRPPAAILAGRPRRRSSRSPRTTPRCSRRCSPSPSSTTPCGSPTHAPSPTSSCACSPTTSTAGFFTTGIDADGTHRAAEGLPGQRDAVGELAGGRRPAAARRAHRRHRRDRTGGSAGCATLAPVLAEHPTAFAHLLEAARRASGAPREIVLVGDPDDPRTVALAAVLRTTLVPGSVRLTATPDADPALSPLLEGRVGGATTGPGATEPRVYVCEANVCGLPATTPEDLRTQLT